MHRWKLARSKTLTPVFLGAGMRSRQRDRARSGSASTRSCAMTIYQIINTSSKGLWPESENVTLVEASSREAMIRAILQGKDSFVEKRLLPCHESLLWDIKQFRGDPDDSDQDDPDAFEQDPDSEVKSLTEEQFIQKILAGIDDNSINDRGFHTAITELQNVKTVNDKVHKLKE